MIKAAALLLLLACAPARAAQLERGPYLEAMSKDMVTVRFRVDVASPAWLSYGLGADCGRFLTPLTVQKENRVQLFGLLPDTTHCYRLYLTAYESSAVYKAFEGSFTTFREQDKPYFRFLAFGDSGSGTEEQLELAERMKDVQADFAVHTGDLLSEGLDEMADEEYFRPYAGLHARLPFFPALGNHDYGRDWKSPAGKGFLKANYTPFHSVPYTGLPPHYYFFDVGHARFFVLDTNGAAGGLYAPPLAPESKQYKWLQHFLSKSAEKTWKFVVLHHPLYSTGAHGPVEGLTAALEPLLLKYGVDLVLQGHDHNYERTLPIKENSPVEGGIIYVTLGGGGSPLYIQRRNEDWSAKFLPAFHFAIFDVKEKALSMTVYDKAGEILDTLDLQK